MNLPLGLRILALLAFVAASTAVIARPELIGGVRPPHAPIANSLLVVDAAWAPAPPSRKHLEVDHGQA
jgi:hypothetical protein